MNNNTFNLSEYVKPTKPTKRNKRRNKRQNKRRNNKKQHEIKSNYWNRNNNNFNNHNNNNCKNNDNNNNDHNNKNNISLAQSESINESNLDMLPSESNLDMSPSESNLDMLPPEIICEIYNFLPPEACYNFMTTNKENYNLSIDRKKKLSEEYSEKQKEISRSIKQSQQRITNVTTYKRSNEYYNGENPLADYYDYHKEDNYSPIPERKNKIFQSDLNFDDDYDYYYDDYNYDY